MNDRAGLEAIRPGDLVSIDSPDGPVALVLAREVRAMRYDGGIYTVMLDGILRNMGGYRLYKQDEKKI